ncbi:hypothetical protein EBBID32_43620 [Sphingobium indicum BiD32]|uniref:Uncharacterized protein n=1 Tax=Sphingobium indicum BiD32 TaxID=1301087 RepID=N1MSM4_9SPHN|nr:hypothetical protein [Sphingobium indicum]CCW19991.1 hypothetical protein EBBID32_43620 [Sphingobium indicum BiD32]
MGAISLCTNIGHHPVHGEVTTFLELSVEVGEHRVERIGLGQLLAKQPDRIGIVRWCAKIDAQEAQPAPAP